MAHRPRRRLAIPTAQVRRATHVFLELEDGHLIDLAALLQGRAPTGPPAPLVLAHSLLTGQRYQISPEALDILLSVPRDRWVAADGQADAAEVERLTRTGLLVSDSDEPSLATLRRRDECLAATAWHAAAAHYHYMSRWSGVDIRGDDGADVEFDEAAMALMKEVIARYEPPPALKPSDAARAVSLPAAPGAGALYDVLRRRRTTRAFDTAVPMRVDDLSTVLRWVFGVHGHGRTLSGVPCIKRTSPSGGCMHPIEAYPIVSGVAGVAPGVYRYDAGAHALELVAALEADDARSTATRLMCGQRYFGDAHVSVVLTARFYRSQWKYRQHERAYASMLMDAGHLSQTMYLVAESLGLGAYVTIAVNARDIDALLGMEGFEEGAIAVVGCGPRSPEGSGLELEFTPT